MRYARAAMTQLKAMTFDFTLLSLSKTAMDVIQAMTRVIRAITVILFIMPAYPLRKKHRTEITMTVIRYLSHPPLLNITGISSADQITPSSRHLSIKNKISSITYPF